MITKDIFDDPVEILSGPFPTADAAYSFEMGYKAACKEFNNKIDKTLRATTVLQSWSEEDQKYIREGHYLVCRPRKVRSRVVLEEVDNRNLL